MRGEADFDRTEELGVTKRRLERIIARAAAKGDLRTELAANPAADRAARPGGRHARRTGRASTSTPPARRSRPRSPRRWQTVKPTADHHARARAVAARLTDEQVVALVGNWRPVKAPPLAEFVRHCLIVEKESGKLIPFEPWPAQEEALAVIEARREAGHPQGPPGRHHLAGAGRHALGRHLLTPTASSPSPDSPTSTPARRSGGCSSWPAMTPTPTRPSCASWPSRPCRRPGAPGSPVGREESCAWPTARATAP